MIFFSRAKRHEQITYLSTFIKVSLSLAYALCNAEVLGVLLILKLETVVGHWFTVITDITSSLSSR